jgi:hypothetical protein
MPQDRRDTITGEDQSERPSTEPRTRRAAAVHLATVPHLILKRSSLAHAGFDDYDVLCEGKLVGRIYHDRGTDTWFLGLSYGYHKDRTPTHGYEPTREAAMAAFAKSWRRE